jgi:hypothetical protein
MVDNRVDRARRGAGVLVGRAALCLALIAAASALWIAVDRSGTAAQAQTADKPAADKPATPVARALPEMVDRKTAECIERGLKYLVNTQRNDGSWLNSGGYGMYPTVMTALGGMALMAGGSTSESGPYAKHVTRAMNYVIRVGIANKDDGLLASDGAEGRSMYGHGFATLFLAQCYGTELTVEKEKEIEGILERAVQLCRKSQSDFKTSFPAPFDKAGGWIYTPEGRSDEGSVTVTQLQALRACRNAGIKVPVEVINKAVAYLKHCQNPDGGISYSASSKGSSRPPISAAAIACFYAAGVYDRTIGGKGEEAEMVEKLVKYVKNVMGVDHNDGHWFYSQLYLGQAMYQRGGQDWKDHYPKIAKRLMETQAPDGSWNGDGVGTTYGTGIACIILQLPYGYLPIYQR